MSHGALSHAEQTIVCWFLLHRRVSVTATWLDVVAMSTSTFELSNSTMAAAFPHHVRHILLACQHWPVRAPNPAPNPAPSVSCSL